MEGASTCKEIKNRRAEEKHRNAIFPAISGDITRLMHVLRDREDFCVRRRGPRKMSVDVTLM